MLELVIKLLTRTRSPAVTEKPAVPMIAKVQDWIRDIEAKGRESDDQLNMARAMFNKLVCCKERGHDLSPEESQIFELLEPVLARWDRDTGKSKLKADYNDGCGVR